MLPLRGPDDLRRLIHDTPEMMTCLKAVAALRLPDGWIGAGFVRAPAWDRLHGYRDPTPLADIDVVYFRPGDGPEAEAALERSLNERAPGRPWSARNQARMHERNADRPYRSTADGLAHWLETPTVVAVRLDAHGRVEVLAPFGLDDLFGLVIRPTPHARQRRMTAFLQRVREKDWLATWPRCRVLFH